MYEGAMCKHAVGPMGARLQNSRFVEEKKSHKKRTISIFS